MWELNKPNQSICKKIYYDRLPKALYLPPEIECANCMISYEEMSMGAEDMYEPTEPSSHNKSNVMSRNLISTPKT